VRSGAASTVLSRQERLAYPLVMPAALLIAGIILYPVGATMLTAFYATDKLGRLGAFVGWENFRLLDEDPAFWEILRRSFLWTGLAVGVKTGVGLALALLLNLPFRGQRAVRLLSVIPWALPIPISAMVWQWTYNSEFGLLNHFLKSTGIWTHPPAWLANPGTAFAATLTVDIWIGLPFMALVFLAGLQAIPPEHYEAAAIDGAGVGQRFVYVTLPSLRPVIVMASLLSVIWTFNDFPVIYIITKGGPINTTDILVTHLYKTAFQFLDFGPASAMALLTFVFLLIFSLLYARLYFREIT
jgi:multiple sugar transport system permease protein